MDAAIQQRVLKRLGRSPSPSPRTRVDSDSTEVPRELHPQIETVLEGAYGPGVLGIANSRINKDGIVKGVFVGRSRPTDPARTYDFGIDLVKNDVRFKRVALRGDSDDEEMCDCQKCKGKRSDARYLLNERLDKKCGASGIPDTAKCEKGEGGAPSVKGKKKGLSGTARRLAAAGVTAAVVAATRNNMKKGQKHPDKTSDLDNELDDLIKK